MLEANVKKRMDPEAPGGQASLDDLFVKGKGVEDGELATALRGSLSLTEGGERVFLEGDFAHAPVKRKLVGVGLALHALVRKGIASEAQLYRSTEWYAEQVQVVPNTVAQELSRLKAKKYFDRNDSGYGIPIWAIRRAILKE
jgi:hypothetical protein